MRVEKILKMLCLTIIFTLLSSICLAVNAEGSEEWMENNVEIAPGTHYVIYYDWVTHKLKAIELPRVVLPPVAYEAIARSPSWIRSKLIKAFEDLTKRDISVLSHSKPVLGDLNLDGLPDLVVGTEDGSLIFYENTGTMGHPQWTRNDRLLAGIYVSNYSAPALVDLNKDGRLDLAVGCGDGKIYFWWNYMVKGEPLWVRDDTVFAGVDVGNYSAPTFADLNADGMPDLIVGCETGELYYFRNTVRGWIRDKKMFEGVYVPSHSTPAFADLNLDGKLYLFIGAGDGNIYVFKNTGTPKKPIWTADETLMKSVNVGAYSAPAFGDIDTDFRVDLLIGSVDGHVYRMGNYGTPFMPNYPLWKSGAEETLISQILWGPGYYPDIDRLTAVNEPDTLIYVEAYANLLLNVDEAYVDEIAYCIANEQITNLKILADKGATGLYETNVKEIYNMSTKLNYVKIVEGEDYTTLAFHTDNDDWVEVPKEVYYQRLVMLNRYIFAPWGWPALYAGNWYMTYLPWDNTYGVKLYDKVKDAKTVTEAMWNVALWIKCDIGAYYHDGTKYGKPPGWYNIYKQLTNPEWTIYCGEFSIITMVAGRAVLIPVANTLNLGEDHQWDEFFNEQLRWVHIDTSVTAPGDVEGLKNYFDNPRVYEVSWGKNVSAVMWWEQGGRYDHIISRTEVTGYTDTALVNFRVVDANGKPIDGARVEAWSHWIEPLYEVPLLSFASYTNMDGETSMHLGGEDKYTFVAITRIGHSEITSSIEEGKVYNFEFRINNTLPEHGEVFPETRKIWIPYKLNLEFKIESGYQANPHWVHVFLARFGWEDYWMYGQGVYLDAYILDVEDYMKFASGLDFKAYAWITHASEGKLTDIPMPYCPIIVLSNERSLTTTLKVHFRAWITN